MKKRILLFVGIIVFVAIIGGITLHNFAKNLGESYNQIG
jgi:cytochrome c-type biogenesis protein CcmE